MDLRFVAIGAVLPSLIDVPVGSLFLVDTFETNRLYGHTLLAAVTLLLLVMLTARRGSVARRRGLGLTIGVFTHLILDVPLESETLWWPFLGTEFPTTDHAPFGDLLGHMLTSPVIVVQEIVGAAYLVGLASKSGLGRSEERRRWVASGTLPL